MHTELFNVQKNHKGEAIGVNFIVASVTPLLEKDKRWFTDGKNPSFSVVYVDPETMLPVDFETWSFDLDYANRYDITMLCTSHRFNAR